MKYFQSLPRRWQVFYIASIAFFCTIGLGWVLCNFNAVVQIVAILTFIVLYIWDLSYWYIQRNLLNEHKYISSRSETFPIVLQNNLHSKTLTLPQCCSTADCKTTDIRYNKVMFFAQKETDFKRITLPNSPFYYFNRELSYKSYIPVLVFNISIDKLAVTNVADFITCINDCMESYCLNLSVEHYKVCQKLDLEQELKMVSKSIIDFDEETENVKMDLELMNELKKLNFPIDSDGNIINCVPAIVDVKKTNNPLSSAALSLRRIQIDYLENGVHRMVLISPVKRNEFIEKINGFREKY